MKKLINLIALVMLVSVNVLTPFSFAQVDDLEDGENLENVLENVWEPEVALEDDVENEENLENLELQEIQELIIMKVEQWTTATLLPWQEFNSVIKTLANGGVDVEYTDEDTNILSIQRVNEISIWVITWEISKSWEQYPVYAWFDWWIIYYYTKAETIKMNEDSQSMFWWLSGLTGLDLSNFDTSDVTNMNFMFSWCENVEYLNLDNWDLSNISNYNMWGFKSGTPLLKKISMRGWKIPEIFQDKMWRTWWWANNSLEEIDVTNWDLSGAKDLRWLFAGATSLKIIKWLDTWDTSNIINMSEMFYQCYNLEEINVSNRNTSKVTNMYEMFRDCDKLEELDLSHFDVSNVTNLREMFQDCNKLKILNLEGRNIGNITSWNIGNIIHYCNNLEELNLSWWDFRNIRWDNLFSNNLSSYQLAKLKKLNMINTKFSWSMYSSFSGIPNVEEIKFDWIDTSNVTDMHEMFAGCGKLTWLDLSNWNTSNVGRVDNMFTYCNNLQGVNMSGRDFRNASANNLFVHYGNATWIRYVDMTNARFSWNLSFIFGQIKNVEEIKLDWVDTSNVTYMNQMFYWCSKLTGLDLSSFDTSNVTNMNAMFNWDSNLKILNLSNFDTSNVTDFWWMFWYCNNLEEINLSWWDFSNYKPYGGLFMSMTAWWIPSLKKLNMRNTKFSWSVESAFNWLSGLQTIDLEWANTSNVTKMNAMFYWCSSLTWLNLSNWDTSNVTGMEVMFSWCNKLESLKLDNWDLSKNPNMGWFISKTPSLKSISMSGWIIPVSFANVIWRIWWNPNNSLEEIDVTNWNLEETKDIWWLFADSRNLKTIKWLDTRDTSGVTNMSFVFYNCYNLGSIDVSNWDTSSVTNMSSMFNTCSSITWLDLSSFDTSNVTSMEAMFVNCAWLQNLNLSNRNLLKNPVMDGFIANTPSLKYISMSGWIIPENFNDKISRNWAWWSSPIEEIDVSNWNLSQTKNIQWVFADSKNLKTIKWLDTWDTSGVTNMGNVFQWCSSLTSLDLASFDTSNVINMGYMFQNCSGLQNLDLSNFITSNVASMDAIFWWCNQLDELNLSWWDFKNVSNASLMMNIMSWNPQSLKKLNMTNTKYTWNVTYAFGWLTKLEELKLNWADTNNVTNMIAMFYWDSSLLELDLSNFDTSKVMAMQQMFYNTPNLKTIYASEKFVTTALSWDTSSKDMFSGTVSVVWWNWTKFDSNFIDKTYALIDKVWQTGYFTDKNAINVKFINTLDWSETTSTFAKWQKLTPPTVNGYHVVWWYLDEAMTQQINLNNWVDSYSEIYVKYERNGSSGGWWWGGGWGWSSPNNTGNIASQTWSQVDSNTGSITSWTNEKEPEATTWSNVEIQTWSQVDSSEQTPQNDTQDINNSPAKASEWQSYSTEFQQAYQFAKWNWITTMPTIQKAQMNTPLTRIAMAKMLSQYAVNVLWKEPDLSKWVVKFNDVTNKMDKDYDDGVTLAYQLWIMWQNMPWNKFRPNDEVTRAEFATALSRLLYSTSDWKYQSTSKYYEPHMQKLKQEWIITNTDPKMKELRGYVMIMLMRSAK